MGHKDFGGDGRSLIEEAEEFERGLLFKHFAEGEAAKASQHIIRHGINVDAADAERIRSRHPDTLMSIAARSRTPDLLDVLLRHSPNLKSMSPKRTGAMILSEAVRHGAKRSLLDKAWRLSMDASGLDVDGFSPLGRAIDQGDLNAVLFLVERGADPLAPAFQYTSGIDLAKTSKAQKSDSIREFFAKPDDLTSIRFHHRAKSEDLDREVIEALSVFDARKAKSRLDMGATIRWGALGRDIAPRVFAEPANAAEEAAHMLRVALSADIEASAKLAIAEVFLFETCMTRRELFMAALKADADEDIFELAVGGYLETAMMGAEGSTLLHEAIERNNVPAVTALMKSNANPELRDRWMRSAIALAEGLSDPRIYELLTGPHGAKWEAPEALAQESNFFPKLDPLRVDPLREVFSQKSIALARKAASGVDKERQRSMGALVELMAINGGLRAASRAPDPQAILALDQKFPLYAEVIEAVAARAAFARKVQEVSHQPVPFKIENILLVGAPGFGKTRFASELARVIGTSMDRVDVGSTSSSFTLSGMDSSYASSKPGKIFMALARGERANPIFLLDEIDKMPSAPDHPVAGSLYPMLESDTAARFVDEFFGVEIDASHINFIATANYKDAIEKAILSRFSVFEIPDPTPEQEEAIAKSVYAEALEKHGASWFDKDLSEEVLGFVAAMTPRESTRAIADALAKACLKGRSDIRLEDFKALPAPRRAIGFN